jgi:hypothetical protein
MTLPMPKADSTLPAPPVAAPPAAERESFVINLCSSTTPMALTQPQLVELKQYKFFVSRRLEDGRERFRLHMGYFDSLLQAEELLPLVRDIYPGAWAGEAPGKRLRAKAAAAAPVAAGAVSPSAPAAEGPSADILANTPTLSAAPEPEPAQPPPALKLELVAAPPRSFAPEPPQVAAIPAAAATPPPAAAAAKSAPAKAAARPAAPKREVPPPFDQRSNVREVLKSLDETARPVPAAPAAPPSRRPAAPVPAAAAAAPAAAPVAAVAPRTPAALPMAVLPESQVLHLLEEKRSDPLNTTSTPAAFSVQLQWSVQPIDLTRVPTLAIFGAYTLYTVEGSREGRRWFGLRLGFFSDAHSAKQVAQYVRSEFATVAVVPVSLKERDSASGASGGATAPQRPTERLPDRTAEFKLLDDTAETPKLAAGAAAAAASKSSAKPKTGTAALAAPPGRPRVAGAVKPGATARAAGRTVRGRGSRVQAHERRAPQTLEETLEILGADQLQMEGARPKLQSEGPIRHLDMKVQKHSPFSRLLDRLSERNR